MASNPIFKVSTDIREQVEDNAEDFQRTTQVSFSPTLDVLSLLGVVQRVPDGRNTFVPKLELLDNEGMTQHLVETCSNLYLKEISTIIEFMRKKQILAVLVRSPSPMRACTIGRAIDYYDKPYTEGGHKGRGLAEYLCLLLSENLITKSGKLYSVTQDGTAYLHSVLR